MKNMLRGQIEYFNGYRNSEIIKKKDRQSDHNNYLHSKERKIIKEKIEMTLIDKCDKLIYADSFALSDDNIRRWNSKPFELLKQNDYIYIKPSEYAVTNSRGNNVIDHIWVKKTLMEKYSFECEIYKDFGDADEQKLYGGVSDHRPVILTVKNKEVENRSNTSFATSMAKSVYDPRNESVRPSISLLKEKV